VDQIKTQIVDVGILESWFVSKIIFRNTILFSKATFLDLSLTHYTCLQRPLFWSLHFSSCNTKLPLNSDHLSTKTTNLSTHHCTQGWLYNNTNVLNFQNRKHCHRTDLHIQSKGQEKSAKLSEICQTCKTYVHNSSLSGQFSNNLFKKIKITRDLRSCIRSFGYSWIQKVVQNRKYVERGNCWYKLLVKSSFGIYWFIFLTFSIV